MAAAAEARLNSLTYTGEKPRWNFKKLVTKHQKQHQILEGLTQHGYAGIDEVSKVRLLLASIKSSRLDAVRIQINATPALQTNFQACVRLYKDCIQQEAANFPGNIQIAGVGTGGRGGGGRDETDGPGRNVGGNTNDPESIEDRFYTKDEYKTLTEPQKMALKRKREAREGNDGRNRRDANRRRNAEARLVAQMAVQQYFAESGAGTDDENANATNPAPAPSPSSNSGGNDDGNRGHPALQRQGTRP